MAPRARDLLHDWQLGQLEPGPGESHPQRGTRDRQSHHAPSRSADAAQPGVCAKLNQADQVLPSLTGVTTRPYYHPPYGGRDDHVRSLAAQIGYRTVYWTIDTLDWQTSATPDSITKIVMDHLKNGAIILMLAGSQGESETLDGLMTKIEQMVTVTQLLL